MNTQSRLQTALAEAFGASIREHLNADPCERPTAQTIANALEDAKADTPTWIGMAYALETVR